MMVVCEICGGNCDNGELVQGICPECLEKESEIKVGVDSGKLFPIESLESVAIKN